jgi:hypothetical protein
MGKGKANGAYSQGVLLSPNPLGTLRQWLQERERLGQPIARGSRAVTAESASYLLEFLPPWELDKPIIDVRELRELYALDGMIGHLVRTDNVALCSLTPMKPRQPAKKRKRA